MITNPERALIASILISPNDSFEVIDRLAIQPEILTHPETRIMLRELLAMRDAGEPIEAATLSAKVPEQYRLAPFEVTSEIVAASPDYWAGLVVKVSQRYELLRVAEELKNSATNSEADTEQAIDKALATLSKTQDKGLVSKSLTLKEAAALVVDDLDSPPRFIPTPWGALNEALGGFRPGCFYVIAARPGVGKTLIGLQLAESIASAGNQTAFFSFEMKEPELATRALSAKTSLNIGKIDRRNLTESEKQRLALAYKDLTNNLHLVASQSREVTQLRPALRAINANTGQKLSAVFIDYLGLMDAKGSSLYEKVTAISGQLKSLAMELDIPVIALAQLNRETEKRGGVPTLADLRDSGAIEQDADAVLMLSNDDQGNLSLTIQKNRQGALGSFTGEIDRSTMTLKNLTKD